MSLYRALDNLNIGVKRGEVFDARRLSTQAREILERQGVIAPVYAPVVESVWPERAPVLEDAGIETLSDVVLSPDAPAGVEAETWADWQAEAEAALTIKCPTCRR